jgi:hypothetical protein
MPMLNKERYFMCATLVLGCACVYLWKQLNHQRAKIQEYKAETAKFTWMSSMPSFAESIESIVKARCHLTCADETTRQYRDTIKSMACGPAHATDDQCITMLRDLKKERDEHLQLQTTISGALDLPKNASLKSIVERVENIKDQLRFAESCKNVLIQNYKALEQASWYMLQSFSGTLCPYQPHYQHTPQINASAPPVSLLYPSPDDSTHNNLGLKSPIYNINGESEKRI